MSNFNEYITTLESARSLADTLAELNRLASKKRLELLVLSNSHNMPWLCKLTADEIEESIHNACAKRYDRKMQNQY